MWARIAVGTGLALGAGAVGVDYRRWRTTERARLAGGSRLLHTARGTVEILDEAAIFGEAAIFDETAIIGETGATPVLMVHGSPGGYDAGPLFARLLGMTGRRLISVSRPGYLRTPASSGPTPTAQADLMAAVLDALDVPRAVVVAISGGGPSALALAQRHPARCARLVLIEALTSRYTDAMMYAALPPVRRAGKWVETMAMKSNLPAYLARCAGWVETSGMLTELARSLAAFGLRRRGYELDMRQFGRLAPMPVDEVTMPTLIVHGTDDTDVPVEQSRALARRLPHARLVLVPGANHRSLWSAPQLSAEVAAFVAATESGSTGVTRQ